MLPSWPDVRAQYSAATIPRFVTELNSNDVLVGRGAPSIDNEGNIRFREIVHNRKSEYLLTNKRQIKDAIAREVVETIRNRRGRFLRRIESLVEAELLGVPRGVSAWVQVDEETVLLKVKQALRGKASQDSATEQKGLEIQQGPNTQSSSPSIPPSDTAGTAEASCEAPYEEVATGSRKRKSAAQGKRAESRSDFPTESEGERRLEIEQIPESFLRGDSKYDASSRPLTELVAPGLPPSLPGILGRTDLIAGRQLPLHSLLQRLPPSQELLGTFLASLTQPSLTSALQRRLFSMDFPHEPFLDAGSSSLATPLYGFGNQLGLDRATARVSSLLSAPTFLNQLELDQLNRSAHSMTPTPTTERQTSLGELVVDRSVSRAFLQVPDNAEQPLFALTWMETLFLYILCRHGIPVYVDVSEHDSAAFSVSGRHLADWQLTWLDVLEYLRRHTIERSSESSRSISLFGGVRQPQAQVTELFGTDSREIASKMVMLLEKARRVAVGKLRLLSVTSTAPELEWLVALGAILQWLGREIGRWASILGVIDSSGQPLALITENLPSLLPFMQGSHEMFSRWDVDSCLDLTLQIASLSRLRSIFVRHSEPQILAQLQTRTSAELALEGLPPWWGSPPGEEPHRNDLLLMMRVLMIGYSNVILGGVEGFSYPLSDRTLTLRDAGMTISTAQHRIQRLVQWLHVRLDHHCSSSMIMGLATREPYDGVGGEITDRLPPSDLSVVTQAGQSPELLKELTPALGAIVDVEGKPSDDGHGPDRDDKIFKDNLPSSDRKPRAR